MIKEIEIDGFLTCRRVRMTGLRWSTAIVGWNGAGKTNILRAIHWAAEIASSQSAMDFMAPVWTSPARVAFKFETDGLSCSYEVRATRSINDDGDVSIHLQEQLSARGSTEEPVGLTVERDGQKVSISWRGEHVNIAIGAESPCIAAILAILPAETEFHPTLDRVRNYLGSVRYYPLDEPNIPRPEILVSHRAYLDWRRSPRRHQAVASVVLRIIHMSLERGDDFQELQSLLGSGGLGLINSINVVSFNPDPSFSGGEDEEHNQSYYLVRFAPESAGVASACDYADLSAGTSRILRALVSVLYDNSSVLLMEHPEDSIHSALLQKLVGLLHQYSNPAQFIITSHSAGILNAYDPQDVRIVAMRNGSTQVSALERSDLKAATKYMSEDGTLAEYLELLEDEH